MIVGGPLVGLIQYNPTPLAKEAFHPKLFLLGFSHRRPLNSHHVWALAATTNVAEVSTSCPVVASNVAVVSSNQYCVIVAQYYQVMTSSASVVAMDGPKEFTPEFTPRF